ncbi:MAG: hypothetical protein H6855_07340 [Rhodospirillales bacterium]|nr:hypothetical protein [Rhodospirillales bacterium]
MSKYYAGELATILGYHYMQETESRDLTLPDGSVVSLEMWRIQWILYERVCERHPDFEEKVLAVLKNCRDAGDDGLNIQLFIEVEAVVERLIDEGKDPLETSGQRLVRRAKMWKFNQSRRVMDSEGGRA